jgi:hypothetical protein
METPHTYCPIIQIYIITKYFRTLISYYYWVNEHKRNWLKLYNLKEKDINEENISSLLAAHAAENKHHVKWEEVKILGKENHCKKRKIHEAAAMHIESNVISQPSYGMPPLWHSIWREERRQIIRERKPRRKEKQRDDKMVRKRGREEDGASSGRKLRRTELAVAVVDRRHRHKMQLRRIIRKPVRLIEVCDAN